MKKSTALAALCTSVLVATGAQAQQRPFSYNYVKAGVAAGTLDLTGGSADTTGLGVSASVALGGNAFLAGGFSGGRAKLAGLSLDQNNFSLGVGGNFPVGPQTDVVGAVSYLRGKASLLGYSEVATGYEFGLSLRHAVTDKVEINAGLGLSIIGSDRVQTTSYGVGGRYKLADKVSLGAGFGGATNSDASSTAFNASVRVEF